MNIVSKEKKETIRVLHNNLEEMQKNISQLKEEGWSDNTRFSMAGIPLFKERVREKEIRAIKGQYPSVEMQYPKERSFLTKSAQKSSTSSA